MTVAFIGAGSVGTCLGLLFQQGGHHVLYGSRHPDQDAAKLRETLGTNVAVTSVTAAAERGDVVVLAVPYQAKQEVIDEIRGQLAGKVVVDLTNPLNADWSPLVLGAENSSGEETAAQVPEARVVKAFNTIFGDVMQAGKQRFHDAPLTAFICGNDEAANQTVAALATDAGFAPLIVGDIKNARYVEALAHLNIQLAVGQQGGTDAGFVYFRR